MKLLLSMLLLFTGDIFCQLKNNRAQIQFKSPLLYLNITDKEGIQILTADSIFYYTAHVDSNWHYFSPNHRINSDYRRTYSCVGFRQFSFFNPDTGVLGGWRSADGELHDYYFTFVNGVAISYGLIEEADAKSIMQRLLDKMKEVGFTNFKL